MPSKSKAQQRLMGLSYSIKKGNLKLSDVDPQYRDDVKKIVDGMSLKSLKKFASTKHEGLPERIGETFCMKYEQFLNENISKHQLDAIEQYADSLFKKFKIDIEFTKHFFDRVNDARNKKPISEAELIGFFKRLVKKWASRLSDLPDNYEAVIKDLNSSINAPFVIDIVDRDGSRDVIFKTIMRKKNFRTNNKTFNI